MPLAPMAILAGANKTTIQPCRYNFPVSDYASAIALANTFTDVVLSVLPTAQTAFAADGLEEIGLVQLIGSIIAQEGEQNGWYRTQQGKIASAAPFLTTSGAAFAFTALQSFIQPGSCPNIGVISDAVPTLSPPLYVVTSPAVAENTTVEFKVSATVAPETNSVVYLSGQNDPVTVSMGPVISIDGFSYFNASFPFTSPSQFSKGLTIAVVVNGTGEQFANANDVVAATVSGPVLIELM